jgi:hypothetical protein
MLTAIPARTTAIARAITITYRSTALITRPPPSFGATVVAGSVVIGVNGTDAMDTAGLVVPGMEDDVASERDGGRDAGRDDGNVGGSFMVPSSDGGKVVDMPRAGDAVMEFMNV